MTICEGKYGKLSEIMYDIGSVYGTYKPYVGMVNMAYFLISTYVVHTIYVRHGCLCIDRGLCMA